MSGIPVYTESPINRAASKASGVTPQTAASQPETTYIAPNAAPATTTASFTSSYPPARPGAAAVPAPTAAAQRYAPLQPTSTTRIDPDEPPAPQPGAVPRLSNNLPSNVPPPPRAGEVYHSPQKTAAAAPAPQMPQPYPPQMSIPPPTTAFGAQPPTSSTSTTTAASSSYPVPLQSAEYGAPRRSLEHPPGYQQNVYASELTSDQRRAQEASNASALGGHDGYEDVGGLDPEGVWSTAKKWAQTAGEKISEAETEVWRRINKE